MVGRPRSTTSSKRSLLHRHPGPSSHRGQNNLISSSRNDTAAGASLYEVKPSFINYYILQKRKLADGTQSTSTCGHEHAKQVVSALEHYRFNSQHLYRDIPEALVNLRTDSRIKTLEAAFAHNEPERIKKAHTLKAAGTRAGKYLRLFFPYNIHADRKPDTYTDTQLSKLATSGILDSKGPTTIWRAMRDRAMLLTSSSVAFRGDSSRSLLWSDMYYYDVPMHAKGQGVKLRVSRNSIMRQCIMHDLLFLFLGTHTDCGPV
jgi:hypothetical protein